MSGPFLFGGWSGAEGANDLRRFAKLFPINETDGGFDLVTVSPVFPAKPLKRLIVHRGGCGHLTKVRC